MLIEFLIGILGLYIYFLNIVFEKPRVFHLISSIFIILGISVNVKLIYFIIGLSVGWYIQHYKNEFL